MINRTVLRYKTRKANQKWQGNRNSISYSQSTQIGVLFTVEDLHKHNKIKEVIKALEEEGKQVTALCYLPTGKENFEFMFDFFTKKEVSYFGSFKNEKAHHFMNKPFDFLFHLDKEVNPFVSFILANSKARCRVGYNSGHDQPLFELMVKPSIQNIESMIDDTLQIVKRIN